MEMAPPDVRSAIWKGWHQELAPTWPGCPVFDPDASPIELQSALGAMISRHNKAGSGPTKDKLIALARRVWPPFEEEWRKVYDEHYESVCLCLSGRFSALSREEAHDLIQPFASRVIPWMLLKLRLLQEPPIHEDVRSLLRDHGLHRRALRQLLWFHKQGVRLAAPSAALVEQQLDALAVVTSQRRDALDAAIEAEVDEWLEQARRSREGRASLQDVAAEALGELWSRLREEYPLDITPWELFRRLFLAAPIHWKSYLGSCAHHLCQRHMMQRQRLVAIEECVSSASGPSQSPKSDPLAVFDSSVCLLLEEVHDWIERKVEQQVQSKRHKNASVWRRRLHVLYARWVDDTPKKALANEHRVAASTITSDCAALAFVPLRLRRKELLELFSRRAEGDDPEAASWQRRRELLSAALRPDTPLGHAKLATRLKLPLALVEDDWQHILHSFLETVERR